MALKADKGSHGSYLREGIALVAEVQELCDHLRWHRECIATFNYGNFGKGDYQRTCWHRRASSWESLKQRASWRTAPFSMPQNGEKSSASSSSSSRFFPTSEILLWFVSPIDIGFDGVHTVVPLSWDRMLFGKKFSLFCDSAVSSFVIAYERRYERRR